MPLSSGDKPRHNEGFSLLGQGGRVGEVYRARDSRPDRTVAMKISQEEFNDRSEREVGAVATLNQSRRLVALSCLLMLCSSGGMAQTALNPQRWQAQYTQVYLDDIETIAPALTPAFSLGPAGSLTSNPAEVIAGNESIKGSYFGSASNTSFLQTNPSVLGLAANHTYRITFQYTILTAPNKPFYFQFFSQTAAAQQNFLAGVETTGAAGTTGTATLTSTLGNYSDYEGFWIMEGTGAISIDNIQIFDAATGNAIASENAEGTGPTLKSGIQLQGAATVVTDPSSVISGKGSLLLSNRGGFVTDPSVIPIGANTVYTIKFDYRIVSPTTSNQVFSAWFQPAGTTDQQLQVTIPAMLKNATVTGTFSSGAQTAGGSTYVLELFAQPGVSLIVDNIFVYRQDVITQNAPPPTWNRLLTAPFPRLGNFFENRTDYTASLAFDEGTPFTYSVEQIESRLAFSDVIAGISLQNQTQNPDSIHRIRALNPNVVILPEKFIEQESDQTPPSFANIDLDYQLLQGIPNAWKATDTAGNVVYDRNYPNLFFMNLSDFVPVVNGQTWRTALQNFLTAQVFPSGLWDGIFLSNTYSALDPAFPHYDNPALFNYDWNRNGLRDETPAATSDMVRAAKIKMVQGLNSSANGLQFTMGHTSKPEFALAPLVNGFAFECFNLWWSQAGAPIASSSPAAWRTAFDAYLQMQAAELPPQTNILEGCGASAAGIDTPPSASDHYLTATPDDIAKHRFTMGTALLGNGFYDYDLKDDLGAPYWFDEFSVDSNGLAVEDRTKKGYLGQPLSGASELTNPGTLVFQEGFDSGALPNSFTGTPGAVSITQTPGEVISGAGSLVISNPDHTKEGSVGASTTAVPLSPGVTYLLTFDWRILETLDFDVGFQIFVMAGGQRLDLANAPGVVIGDSGTMHFPFTIPSAGNWTINIYILDGGGKVAIDNVKIYQGGVGPWRRDFENGFVLVNPFAQPYTFSAADLAGALNRTGIHRIKGTQAPDVNNGQSVPGELTLGAFDAIILLADRLNVPGCSYSLNYSGQAFSAQGGTGTIAITTGGDCPWSVGALPTGVMLTSTGSGVGNGSVTFQVLPNLGGGVSSSFTIADQTFSIEQSAASIAGLAAAGSLGQVASEGTWDFSLIGINLGASAATARFSFADNNGNPLMLPLTFPQSAPSAGPELASTIDRTLNPNAQIVMESTGPDNVGPLVGAGQLSSNGNTSGFGIFSNPKQRWNAVVPLETRNASKYILAFDNTPPLTTGLAVASLGAQATNVPVIIRDDKGMQIGNPTISLSALGHTSFMLNDPRLGYPVTNGQRGTIEFDTPPSGQLSVLGLRANGPALTTLPVLANVGTAGGSITHVAFNGGWTSVFYIVNTGNASAQFTLSFFDENGVALPVPLLLPQSGTNSTTAALMQTLAPGAMVVVNTNEQDSPTAVVGSAQLTTTGNISGFEIFRWNTFNQEASVPLETRTPNSFVLVFDNTNGLTTGVALANLSGSATNITVTLRDDTGAPLPSMPVNLPARGHKSFMLPDPAWYPAAANKRGMAEFSVPQGLQISVIGLRAKSDGTLTTIPVLTK